MEQKREELVRRAKMLQQKTQGRRNQGETMQPYIPEPEPLNPVDNKKYHKKVNDRQKGEKKMLPISFGAATYGLNGHRNDKITKWVPDQFMKWSDAVTMSEIYHFYTQGLKGVLWFVIYWQLIIVHSVRHVFWQKKLIC